MKSSTTLTQMYSCMSKFRPMTLADVRCYYVMFIQTCDSSTYTCSKCCKCVKMPYGRLLSWLLSKCLQTDDEHTKVH